MQINLVCKCVSVCVCVYARVCACERERERDLLFSEPALERSPFSSAYLSGRKRESDGNNFLGAVSKLFNLCVKYVYWYLSSSGASATLQTCKTFQISLIKEKKEFLSLMI